MSVSSHGLPPLDAAPLRKRWVGRSTAVGRRGMAATSHTLASVAGLEALRAGGDAVDAAVAANAVLTVVEPMSCGLGGDLFALVWREREGRLYGLNASGRSARRWTLADAAAMGLERIPQFSPLAWSVPGCVSGWAALVERFGRRTLADALAPAVEHAREGFVVSPVNAAFWDFDARKHPTLARTFHPEGRAPRFGEIFRNEAVARSLEIVARDGAEGFYRGEIAERVGRWSAANGGRLAAEDFAAHAAEWVEPVSSSYRGWDVWELPPNGQGVAVLQILNMLEQFDLAGSAPESALETHLLIEATRLAYEDRARCYADPAFADVPVDRLVDKAYARERAALIDPRRAAGETRPGEFLDASETVYLATADGEGNMVSLIESNYRGWGSYIVPDGLGFSMQDRGSCFALDPKHPNRLEPGKRPFHTIIPGFVTQGGRARFAFGVMGGDFQPQGQARILINLLDHGMSPQQAGDRPRAMLRRHPTPIGVPEKAAGRIALEPGFSEETIAGLEAMGHTVMSDQECFGGYQGVWRADDPIRLFGASDSRKDGCAIGW